jgi:uncharacterized protein
MVHLDSLVQRQARGVVQRLVSEEPAVLLEGPRGSGKSTLLRSITQQLGGRIVDLDDAATLNQVLAGSDSLLLSPGLVAIDEFQRAPDTLLTVKRIVDREGGAGRFLIAGSVSDRLLPNRTETLTGRVHRTVLLPLSAGEVLSQSFDWLSAVLSANGSVPEIHTDLRRDAVFELISAGGYPGALRRPTQSLQRRWLTSYLATVADRDLPALVDIRNPGAVAALYRLCAQRASATVNVAEFAQRLQLRPETVRTYLNLLQRCFLIDELPSWSLGVSAREGRRPKIHVVDTGLAAVAISADAAKLARLPLGGQLVESFVVTELRKQAAMLDEPLQFAHFRDRSGSEVDLVIERLDGSVLAIEVKAATSSGLADAKGLLHLRNTLGDRFLAGVVLHTGPLAARLDDRIWASPIAALWGGGGHITGSTGLSTLERS